MLKGEEVNYRARYANHVIPYQIKDATVSRILEHTREHVPVCIHVAIGEVRTVIRERFGSQNDVGFTMNMIVNQNTVRISKFVSLHAGVIKII